MRQLRILVGAVCGALAAAGCGSPPRLLLPTPAPAAPASSVYLGTWSGTLTDQAAGTGSISIVFNQGVAIASGGVTVSGTFNIQRQDAGTVAVICVDGTVFGSDVQQTFSLSCTGESGTIVVALDATHDHAGGTYLFSGSPFVKGTVQLDKH
jgi:hypothetical protein